MYYIIQLRDLKLKSDRTGFTKMRATVLIIVRLLQFFKHRVSMYLRLRVKKIRVIAQ